jgi:antitoxin component of MazEF toxin-antitoxin module
MYIHCINERKWREGAMTMTATLSKWGNGVGVLLPKAAREEAGLEPGDRVRMISREGSITIVREDQGWTLHELMRGYDGPPPEVVDTGEPFGREVW